MSGLNFGKADLVSAETTASCMTHDTSDSLEESCGPFTVEKVKIRKARFIVMELAQ